MTTATSTAPIRIDQSLYRLKPRPKIVRANNEVMISAGPHVSEFVVAGFNALKASESVTLRGSGQACGTLISVLDEIMKPFPSFVKDVVIGVTEFTAVYEPRSGEQNEADIIIKRSVPYIEAIITNNDVTVDDIESVVSSIEIIKRPRSGNYRGRPSRRPRNRNRKNRSSGTAKTEGANVAVVDANQAPGNDASPGEKPKSNKRKRSMRRRRDKRSPGKDEPTGTMQPVAERPTVAEAN